MYTAAYFNALYAADSDPWCFKTRWYEIRKRALMLAALPRQRYRHAFEPGCSNGEFTASLAERCDRVYACDMSDVIVEQTRARFAANSAVSIARAAIPIDWPQQHFDLIVFNEIGYYLTAAELNKTIDCMVDSLEPAGELLVCHWRGALADSEIDSDFIHNVFVRCAALSRQVHHREPNFFLDVFGLRTDRKIEQQQQSTERS